jgi:hypothetical protein
MQDCYIPCFIRLFLHLYCMIVVFLIHFNDFVTYYRSKYIFFYCMSWLLIALNILHAHLRLYQRSYAALNINPQHGGLCGEVPALHSMLLTATQQLSVLVWYAFCNCLVVVCINGPVFKSKRYRVCTSFICNEKISQKRCHLDVTDLCINC